MRDLPEVIDTADLMVRRGRDLVPEYSLRSAIAALDELRVRAAQLHPTLVMALVGGTGCGKSSLLNALAGDTIASVGRVRPHTEEPLAWVPEDADPVVAHTLKDLGIEQRVKHSQLPGVALLDLPDMDSVVTDHRLTVERLLPRVDGMLWVVDPEKYHDATLHDEFLVPLAGYAEQTAFVLNKIDRLPEDQRQPVATDVRRVLAAAGYPDAKVFPVAASPPSGEPIGLGDLRAFLDKELDGKRVSYGKLVADIATVVKDLGLAGGVWRGASIRLGNRWTVTRDAALAAMRPGSVGPSEDALCRIEDLVAAGAAEAGGVVGQTIRAEVDSAAVLEALSAAQAAIAEQDVELARHELDVRIGGALRDLLWERSYFAALVAEAHIGIRQVAHRFGVSVA